MITRHAPAGIFSATLPSTVGRLTEAPSTASGRLTGSSTWMSLPTRVKKGCGRSWT